MLSDILGKETFDKVLAHLKNTIQMDKSGKLKKSYKLPSILKGFNLHILNQFNDGIILFLRCFPTSGVRRLLISYWLI
jgi:hypothetical protein